MEQNNNDQSLRDAVRDMQDAMRDRHQMMQQILQTMQAMMARMEVQNRAQPIREEEHDENLEAPPIRREQQRRDVGLPRYVDQPPSLSPSSRLQKEKRNREGVEAPKSEAAPMEELPASRLGDRFSGSGVRTSRKATAAAKSDYDDVKVLYMLPRKRAGEAEVEDQVVDASLLKKTRVDCLISSASTAAAAAEESNQSGPANGMDMECDANGSNSTEIDEDLHSRQLAVYGRETMRRLFASNVLISGLNGLGTEIAKNLVLAGVKSVTLHDEGNVEMWDLSSNFFFSEGDIGRNRALGCVQKLQELNNAVIVSTLTGTLSKEDLSKFQAVVFTNIGLETAIEYDDYCRSQQPPIAFIKSEARGLFGSVFCDFGPEFTVFDVDGEEPHTGIIASISNDNPALVSCVDDERLEFQDGDLVVFSEVQGMTELNDGKPRKVKNARPFSFTLEEDTTQFGAYTKGGIVTQVKQPKVLHFKSLKDALRDPGEFLLSDFSKFDRPPLLHLAFQALDKFRHDLGRFPVAGSEDDAQNLIALTDQWYITYGEAEWKKKAEDCLASMNLYGEETRHGFEHTLSWLNQWACSRSFGLGTRIPWDEQFLVESLSDSTLYMAYYTIAHILQNGDLYGSDTSSIKPEQLTDEVWDYVFGGGPVPKSDIPASILDKMKQEFEYWYPFDLRVSGKDLIQNHLTFCIYNHTALLPEQKWPRGFRCNGHLMLNSEKMSKSIGNFRTLRQAIEEFSSDATRFSLADAGDGMDDANFVFETANAAILRLTKEIAWMEEISVAESSLRAGPPTTYADHVFANEINIAIKSAEQHYNDFMFRDALKVGFYDLQSARDEYRFSCGAGGMNRDLLWRFMDAQTRLITPICPHYAEHVWKNILKKDGFVVNAGWPVADSPDLILRRANKYLQEFPEPGATRGSYLELQENACQQDEPFQKLAPTGYLEHVDRSMQLVSSSLDEDGCGPQGGSPNSQICLTSYSTKIVGANGTSWNSMQEKEVNITALESFNMNLTDSDKNHEAGKTGSILPDNLGYVPDSPSLSSGEKLDGCVEDPRETDTVKVKIENHQDSQLIDAMNCDSGVGGDCIEVGTSEGMTGDDGACQEPSATEAEYGDGGNCQVLEKFGDNACRVELPDDVFISDVFNIRHLTPYAGENSSLRSSFSEAGENDEDISSDQSSGQSNQALDVPVPATQNQQSTTGSLRRSKRLQNKRA